MLRDWRPTGEGEIIIVRAIRRARAAAVLRYSSDLLIGLSFGLLVADCFTWLRTAHFGSPYTSEIYRALHIKLPHSEWSGMAQAIMWALNQSLCLIAVAPLMSAGLLLKWLGAITHPPAPRPFRLQPKQILLLPALPAVDPRIAQIKETYRQMDAVREPAPLTPQEHAGE